MDSIGLFNNSNGMGLNGKIIQAGSYFLNSSPNSISISEHLDYGIITNAGINLFGSYITMYPIYFAPGMTNMYVGFISGDDAYKTEKLF